MRKDIKKAYPASQVDTECGLDEKSAGVFKLEKAVRV